jgi:two-component sensor histidine kinase
LEHIFSEAQGRVQSMALVHEHIYKVGDLNRVNVKAHVLALAEGILANHGLRHRVRVDLQVTFEKATVETLIPLSLLLNELLTNSAKHAFQGREAGVIKIVLRRMADHRCELLYVDDGAGLSPEQFSSGTSFGMELVRMLAEQLNGRIRLLQGEGTTFELSFEPERPRLRAAS